MFVRTLINKKLVHNLRGTKTTVAKILFYMFALKYKYSPDQAIDRMAVFMYDNDIKYFYRYVGKVRLNMLAVRYVEEVRVKKLKEKKVKAVREIKVVEQEIKVKTPRELLLRR